MVGESWWRRVAAPASLLVCGSLAAAGLASADGAAAAVGAGAGEGWKLTPGLESRQRGEFYDRAQWDKENGEDPFLLQRYLLSADLDSGRGFRFHLQLLSALESGREDGPRPIDQDRLDLHQAFADWRLFENGAGGGVTLRVGRQELAFGSQRLVSNRLGPNVPRSFDGADLIVRRGGWLIDAFAARPVAIGKGSFDDRAEKDRTFWGIYAAGPFPALAGAGIDLYYFDLRRDRQLFDQGAAAVHRSTAGARLWRREAPWDYNFELVYQWGRFGGGNIAAWTLASDSGFTFESARLRPRAGLKADVTSGDRDPADPSLQSFDPLFPRGGYFGESQLVGPVNHIDLHPSLELHPTGRATLTLAWDFFWRQSRRDGLYDVAGFLVRQSAGANERFVGSQAALAMTFELSECWTFAADLEYFFAGPFLRESGTAADVTFASATLTYRY